MRGAKHIEGPAVVLWDNSADISCCIICTLLRAVVLAVVLSPAAAQYCLAFKNILCPHCCVL